MHDCRAGEASDCAGRAPFLELRLAEAISHVGDRLAAREEIPAAVLSPPRPHQLPVLQLTLDELEALRPGHRDHIVFPARDRFDQCHHIPLPRMWSDEQSIAPLHYTRSRGPVNGESCSTRGARNEEPIQPD